MRKPKKPIVKSEPEKPYQINRYYELPKKQGRNEQAIELLIKYLPLLMQK